MFELFFVHQSGGQNALFLIMTYRSFRGEFSGYFSSDDDNFQAASQEFAASGKWNVSHLHLDMSQAGPWQECVFAATSQEPALVPVAASDMVNVLDSLAKLPSYARLRTIAWIGQRLSAGQSDCLSIPDYLRAQDAKFKKNKHNSRPHLSSSFGSPEEMMELLLQLRTNNLNR